MEEAALGQAVLCVASLLLAPSSTRSRGPDEPPQKKDPDNYTDEETFLDHLQRNPRLRPYDFWPLVADSTAIVQQLCAMVIFVNCFAGIAQGRISPVTVVGWGSAGTVAGWLLWDTWVGQEQAAGRSVELLDGLGAGAGPDGHHADASSAGPATPVSATDARPRDPAHRAAPAQSRTSSTGSVSRARNANDDEPLTPAPTHSHRPPYGAPRSRFSPRNQARLATAKSALLIYCALLGLSPILKSLTQSTASDSIWALGFWLMVINVIGFDYGAGSASSSSSSASSSPSASSPGTATATATTTTTGGSSSSSSSGSSSSGSSSGFPASLSTNAALMASTVLASRLPSTTHVFSLTLFSIEVFGLFPVFRRHLRHTSWRGHCLLTWALVMAAGGGTAVSLSRGGWRAALLGVLLGNLLTGLVMGLCSWWLIGLQQYKNEIHGPWDPARPIIRRRWD